MTIPENLKENFTGYLLVAITCFGAGWAAAVAVRHQAELVTITMSEHREFLSCSSRLQETEERAISLGESWASCEIATDLRPETAASNIENTAAPDPEILSVQSENSVYVTDTPAEMFARSEGANNLQSAENFRRNYVGKKLRLRGAISVLQQSRLLFNFKANDSNLIGYAVDISLRDGEIDKVSHVSTGTIVTAEGVISAQTLGIKVFLDDGVVIDTE